MTKHWRGFLPRQNLRGIQYVGGAAAFVETQQAISR